MKGILQPVPALQIDPLTHYQRDPTVKAQILDTLNSSSDELSARAKITNPEEAGYLLEETLVYLIRKNHRENQDRLVDELVKVLVTRCAKLTDRRLRFLEEGEGHDAFNDVIQKLFERILDFGSGRGDFFQVKFGFALKRLTISVFRNYSTRFNEDSKILVPVSGLAGHEIEEDESLEEEESIASIPFRAILDPPVLTEKLAIIHEGLGAIPEEYRTVFILHEMYDWQIESNDPSTPTLSKYFHKTPRTIQNWLRKAERALEEWRGEKP